MDATPDLIWQLDLLKEDLGRTDRPRQLRQPDGVFLTHAHMGHVGGLQQFGRESMGARDLPVYASAAMQELLLQSRLLGPTIDRFQFHTIEHGTPVSLGENLSVEPLSVPHRDEWGAGTFGYRIQGPERSVLYLPDIDRWEDWPDADTVMRSVDVAIVDACFYSPDEIGGRTDIPHPFVTDTLERFADIPGQLVLTHLNHTNPLLDRAGEQRHQMLAAGFDIAETGSLYRLD